MKYIYSKLNSDGDTYDHTEVRAAFYLGKYTLEAHSQVDSGIWEWFIVPEYARPTWDICYEYRLKVPDSYGISYKSELSSRRPKDDKEIMLDRIKELEDALESIIECCEEDSNSRDHHSRQYEIRGIAKSKINERPT